MAKLVDLAKVIRSKNSGPYELTIDIIFNNKEDYNKVCKSNKINKELVSKLYKIKIEDIINIIYFEVANAIKITIKRPITSGNLGETDVYGAQQHAPFLYIEI